MFEQVLVEAAGRTNKGWTLLVSSGMQMGLVTALCIFPMLNPDFLPRTTLRAVLTAPAPPPPPPPPLPPVEQVVTARPAARPVFDGRHMLEPVRIPQTVVMLAADEAPIIASAVYTSGDGVPGGLPGGVPGGMATVFHNLAPVTPPPPAVKAVEKEPVVKRIAVISTIQEARCIHKVTPVYPALARAARISGTVRLTAIIAREQATAVPLSIWTCLFLPSSSLYLMLRRLA